jgi:hypothetical protein
LAFDSDTTLLSAFDPATGTFDASTAYVAAAFSIKGA